jgi:hypothetical protein
MLINELHRYLNYSKLLLPLLKRTWPTKQSIWRYGLYFKTFARIDFIKSILKLSKSNADSIVALAQPQVLNEKPAVVMQYETPTTEEPLILYKIVRWSQVHWCQRYVTYKQITILQIFTLMVAKWSLLSKHWNILRASCLIPL